jgi:ABC-type microcin C transport system permease subunit YejB
MTLVQLHAAVVCAWFGAISAEAVLELTARDATSRRFAAVVHRWIDLLFEGPLLLLVLVTGAILLWRAWPPSPLLVVKIVAGLIAVIANLVCIPLVHRRAFETDDARIEVLSRQVAMTGFAIPFGLVALVIGFGYFAAA